MAELRAVAFANTAIDCSIRKLFTSAAVSTSDTAKVLKPLGIQKRYYEIKKINFFGLVDAPGSSRNATG